MTPTPLSKYPELSEAAKACKTSLVFDAVEVNQVKEKVDLAEAIISSISNAELENTLEIVDKLKNLKEDLGL